MIKPSGLRYELMRAHHMVVLDLDGRVVEGDLKPSSDTASHLYIYRHREDVNGVVHTHSPYATAFAANGMSIPVVLTAIADEFGGPIPCGGFSLIGDELIGKIVVEIYRQVSSGAAEEPRGLHYRRKRGSRGESCRDDRGRCAERVAGDAIGHAGRDPRRSRREIALPVHAPVRAERGELMP